MPENEEQNQVHKENPNAYNYNPNRPQHYSVEPYSSQIQSTSSSSLNQDLKKEGTETKNEHADTKKVVDTAAKGVAEAYAPGVGGMVYDAAKKAPVVGGAIDKATDQIAEKVDRVPGAKNLSKKLNDSGATDAANSALSTFGSKGAGSFKSAGNGSSGGQDVISAKNMPTSGLSKNAQFNQMKQNEIEVERNQSPTPSSDSNPSSKTPLSNQEGNNTQENEPEKKTGLASLLGEGNGFPLFNKKSLQIKIAIGAGAGVALFLIIFIVLFGGSMEEQALADGYYDQLCNYNDTKVTLTNCYDGSITRSELGNYSLADFVVNMTYAYTQGESYSDEALKALMIVLKTNALAYGNYNSSDKNIDVRICDIYSNYANAPSGESSELWMLEGADSVLSDYTNLYNEISGYLYLSSSYQSSISSLSAANILAFDQSSLTEFESLAQGGSTYSEILSSIYSSTGEGSGGSTVYRDTLFLGDSRTRGIQLTGLTNDSNTVYGVGYGYNWLIGNGMFSTSNTNSTTGGIAGINGKMRDGVSYNIVIWLGVNDLGVGANTYYQEYYNLATNDWRNHMIYIVSVGPVLDSLSRYVTNESITTFNNEMRDLINGSGLSNLTYIDLGYTEASIIEYDGEGIHYSNTDYRNIYQIITNSLGQSLNQDYQLYYLNDYCTYYQVTENTAYWWPVGSATATQGNIYGGEPTSTIVTSNFGRRNTGIQGASTNHKGIDIAKEGSACGDIVIASRPGTVTKVTDDGGARGTYVKIDHGDGVETLYQHMQRGSYTVSEGDTVTQGQMIGLIGNTGVGSGCHLHFEVIVNNVPVDPLDYVDPSNPRPVSSSDIHVSLAGDSEDNKNMVCMTLSSSGFSDNAVAAMMTNFRVESGFNAANLQDSYETSLGYSDEAYTNAVDNGTYTNFVHDSAGYGLAQWTYYSRKQDLYNYARSRNTSIGDLGMQLEFLVNDLPGYTTTYKYLTGNYAAADISTYFCLEYENPANPSTECSERTQAYLQEMLTYVGNGCS